MVARRAVLAGKVNSHKTSTFTLFSVAERVLQNEHARVLGRTGGHSLQIQRLPEHSVSKLFTCFVIC